MSNRENFYKVELFLEFLTVQKNLSKNTCNSYYFDIKKIISFFSKPRYITFNRRAAKNLF